MIGRTSRASVAALLATLAAASGQARTTAPATQSAEPVTLRAGAAAVALTPFGPHPDWDGTITPSGIWGERFTDLNANGAWDAGEPFEDDDGNTALDASAKGKYDGIWLAGFGSNRLARSKHDDYWARALVLERGETRIAIVVLDFIGYYTDGGYYGLRHVLPQLDPALGIQEVLLASTHNHEGPDTIGPWGPRPFGDGKYPKYLKFVDRQIAKAITLAASGLAPVRVRLGRTTPAESPSIAGMQTRTGGRPPRVFDEELRVMQFVSSDAGGDRTVATLVNWNTHPESMEDENTALTSDFPGAVREAIERRYGGTALYVSGDLGAAEIVGDTNNDATDRITFDGRAFPLAGARQRPTFTFERMAAIGRDVAKAGIEALDRGDWSRSDVLEVRKADVHLPMDNPAYLVALNLGVLDTPMGGDPPQVRTSVYALRIGDAQMVTSPGELFPEVFLGVARHGRRDCPAADTGRPPEPSIRDALTANYQFVLGLSPDELGYLVPGSDFHRAAFDAASQSLPQVKDACAAAGVPEHYHETNSASSLLAPVTACVTVALLSGKTLADPACRDVGQYSSWYATLQSRSGKRKDN